MLRLLQISNWLPGSLTKTALACVVIFAASACNTTSRPKTNGRASTKPTTPTQVGTGNPNAIQHVNSASGDGDPVLVSIAGWNSCVSTATNATPNPYGMNNYTGFMQMKQRIEAATGRKTRFVLSCFSPNINSVRFYSSAAPDTLREGPISQLYEEITRQAQEGRGSAYVNGHSYGGWFAMQAALNVPETVRIGLLSTMDAISPHTCDAETMKNVANNLLEGKIPPSGQGCGTSPTDITSEQKQQIRQRVGWWHNYFQVDFFNVLHATAIMEASGNTEYRYPFPSSINGHINMGLDNKVWANLADRIAADIQNSVTISSVNP